MEPGISKDGLATLVTLGRARDEEDPAHTNPLATTVIAYPRPRLTLSARELQVLRNVATGLTDKQVAARLGISPKTVRNHLGQVFSKLGASNRVEAVINALKAGLLTV